MTKEGLSYEEAIQKGKELNKKEFKITPEALRKKSYKMKKENKEIIEEVMKEVKEDGIASVENHNEETLDYNELDIKDYLKRTLKLKNEKRI